MASHKGYTPWGEQSIVLSQVQSEARSGWLHKLADPTLITGWPYADDLLRRHETVRRRRTPLLLLLGVFAASLTSCGESTDNTPSAPASTCQVVLGFPSGPDNYEVLRHQTARAGVLLTQAISLSLLTQNPAGEIVPWLAEDLPEIRGRETYWELPAAATWHDGRVLTAADFVATFEHTRSSRVPLGRLGQSVAQVESISSESDHRLKVVFRVDPRPTVLDRFGRGFLAARFDGDVEVGIGYGPYRRVETDRQETRLERVPSFWGESLPRFKGFFGAKTWRERYVPDQESLFRLFLAGEVDLLGLADHQVERVPRELATDTYWLPGFSYLGWNVVNGDTSSADVRRILADLVPRAELLEGSFKGHSRLRRLTSGEVYETTRRDDLRRATFARQRLDDLGIKDSDGDGRRDRAGANVVCTVSLPVGDIPWMDALMTAWRVSLEGAGIGLEVRRAAVPALLEDLKAGRFQVFLLMQTGADDIDGTLRSLLHSSETRGGRNLMGYQSPEMDQLLESLASTTDRESRHRLGELVDQKLETDQPITVLFQHASHLGWNPKHIRFTLGERGLAWPSIDCVGQ